MLLVQHFRVLFGALPEASFGFPLRQRLRFQANFRHLELHLPVMEVLEEHLLVLEEHLLVLEEHLLVRMAPRLKARQSLDYSDQYSHHYS